MTALEWDNDRGIYVITDPMYNAAIIKCLATGVPLPPEVLEDLKRRTRTTQEIQEAQRHNGVPPDFPDSTDTN